jgi:hypothetical protein
LRPRGGAEGSRTKPKWSRWHGRKLMAIADARKAPARLRSLVTHVIAN